MDSTVGKTTESPNATATTKIGQLLRAELGPINLRFLLIHLITGIIPRYAGARTRTRILRLAGLHIGRSTLIMGTPHMYGTGDIRSRLAVGERGMINIGCFFELNAPLQIGDNVSLGHEVMILTTSHQIGGAGHRAGPLRAAQVTIGDGAWIGARSVLLPGVTIGAGSIVAAGAIVTKDVPPNTLVGGVPARPLRDLSSDLWVDS